MASGSIPLLTEPMASKYASPKRSRVVFSAKAPNFDMPPPIMLTPRPSFRFLAAIGSSLGRSVPLRCLVYSWLSRLVFEF